MTTAPQNDHWTLLDCRAGDSVKVVQVTATGDDGVRLKRMGLCEGRSLKVIQHGDPMILSLLNSRIGLSRRLAAAVRVLSENQTN